MKEGDNINYYEEIKNELLNNEINRSVKNYSINRSDLNTYYNVGKLIVEAQGGEARAKYGEGLIKEYSVKLINEVDKKYNITYLKRMRLFYLMVKKGATLSHQLTWSHYSELVSIKDVSIFNYYVNVIKKNNLSIRDIRKRIKSKEYERLPEEAKNKINTKEELALIDIVKNPIIINNNSNTKIVSEKILQKVILEDISSFLKELGSGFTFIENEYRIKMGSNYNFIDLLLYNIKYKCYVVVELKVTTLKKEHTGQIMIYMNYIDKNLKTVDENDTVGIIICKQNNEFIVKYCSDSRIISREYICECL